MTCVGYPAQISEGESCKVTGEYTEHPMYGQQLKISSYEPCAPEDDAAVFRYLSSGAVKGIGESLAKRILKKFGSDTMRILDEEPERLSEVKGISEKMARSIGLQIAGKRESREAMMFLGEYGISTRQAIRIWDTYGMEMYAILRENPYRLAEDIGGIGFAQADEIARKAGILPDSEYRIRSGLLYIQNTALSEGSTCLPRQFLLQRAVELLRVPQEAVSVQLDNMIVLRELYLKKKDGVEFVYSSYAYHKELRIARLLFDLDAAPVRELCDDELDLRIRELEEKENLHLDERQKEAVRLSALRPLLLITGGPGTGKTTTINTIIRLLISCGKAVVLAAPTGRAAKRMSEATGFEAMTIHRLLGYKVTGNAQMENEAEGYRFEHDASDPLEADAVIIDEMSMVDLFLFEALLSALKPGTRLILVGDADQLPSVGPGRVLGDMIASGAFRTIVLNKIFRQASQSEIIMNAHRIIGGEPVVLDNKGKDFFFLERRDPMVIYKHTVQLLQDYLPKYVGCAKEEIQVLTPMRKGALGAVRMNEVLQSVLNPKSEGKQEYTAHEVVFREGDKVMQTRNNYQMEWKVQGNFGMALETGAGIFNGDFGRILEIDRQAQMMRICFDEQRMVEYPFSDLDDLDLAYAITVHKSQGSEYPAVILPLLPGPPGLYSRNLLYTAITRARSCVMILGSRQCVMNMAANTSQYTRYTGLADRIREVYDAAPACD